MKMKIIMKMQIILIMIMKTNVTMIVWLHDNDDDVNVIYCSYTYIIEKKTNQKQM